MKKNLFLFMVALLAFACTKVEYTDFDGLNPQDDGVLKISVSGGPLGLTKSTLNQGDTIVIEGGNVYNFSYSSSVAMTSVQWTFENNGTTSNEIMPSNYYARVFSLSSVTLVGIDGNGNAHQAQIWLDNRPRVGGDPILYKGKTLLTAGYYRQEFWIYKNGAYFTAGNYLLKGNVTSPPWQTSIVIPPADTNYRLENGQLYVMPSGENGHWTKVFIDSPVNFDAEVAPLVRMSSGLGEQWASFKGSQFVNASNYGLMRYHVDANGDVTPSGGNNLIMPGLGDDDVLRFEINQNDTSLTIYQNNEQPFSGISPWIQFKDNDSWATPLHVSSAVEGFPNWSKYTLPLSSLPVRARFGSIIANPVANNNNASSIYYDQIYKDLFVNISVLYKSGQDGKQQFILDIKKPG